MSSESCQSGPASRTTTFLPAFASTEANTDPDAPAPTMTTSTFSFAMSPPLLWNDVGLIGDAEQLVAFHRAIHDVDRVGAQERVDERRGRALPAVDLVLAHVVRELALLIGGSLGELVPERAPAPAVDGAHRGAIEVHERRAHVEDARLQQRLLGRDRDLVVDEMRDAGRARTLHERVADRLDDLGLGLLKEPERDVARARLTRREHDRRAAHREGERTQRRALHEGASFDGCHRTFSPLAARHAALSDPLARARAHGRRRAFEPAPPERGGTLERYQTRGCRRKHGSWCVLLEQVRLIDAALIGRHGG